MKTIKTKLILITVMFLIIMTLAKNVNANTGYEYLDNNEVLHIWNPLDDYYFNVSSGIQWSNYYNETWTTNVFCGYYENPDRHEFCVDSVPFIWSIDSDNESYVSYSGYYDVSLSGSKIRLSLTYDLFNDSTHLKILPAAENTGKDFDDNLGFVWKIQDIKINNDFVNDQYEDNDESFLLNQTINYINSNMSKKLFQLTDRNKTEKRFIELYWEFDNYTLNITSEAGQYNAPVKIDTPVGSLAKSQLKYRAFYWKDPLVYNNLLDATDEKGMSPPGAFINRTHGYVFFADGNGDLAYSKTTNNGSTWSSPTSMSSAGNFFGTSVWYEQWTPGDTTGTAIHIASGNPQDDNIYHCEFYTNNDSYTCDAVYDAGALTATDGGFVITKTTDGMLWIGGQTTSAQILLNSTVGGPSANWEDMTPTDYFNDDDDYFSIVPTPINGSLFLMYIDVVSGDFIWGLYNNSNSSWSSLKIGDNLLSNYMSGAWANGGFTIDNNNNIVMIFNEQYSSYEPRIFKYVYYVNNNTFAVNPSATVPDRRVVHQVGIVFDELNEIYYMPYVNGSQGNTDIGLWNTTSFYNLYDYDMFDFSSRHTTIGDDVRFVRTNFKSDEIVGYWYYNDDTDDIFWETIDMPVATDDTTPPKINNVLNHTITNQSVIINWTTDETANGTINYGLTTSLGTYEYNTTDGTNHHIQLDNLKNDTTYYYNVTSCDTSGNCNTTGVYDFTTLVYTEDSCTYGGSGDHTWLYQDYCEISTDVVVYGKCTFAGDTGRLTGTSTGSLTCTTGCVNSPTDFDGDTQFIRMIGFEYVCKKY